MPAGIPNTVASVWKRINTSGDCWEWQGRVDTDGYGIHSLGGRNRKAHRLALESVIGHELPSDRLVCHRCDNPRCCRPSHLYLGSAADNARDRSRAGSITGSRNGFARLTEAQVAEIKWRLLEGQAVATIAEAFRVTPGAIYFIRNGVNWKHVAPKAVA